MTQPELDTLDELLMSSCRITKEVQTKQSCSFLQRSPHAENPVILMIGMNCHQEVREENTVEEEVAEEPALVR